MWAARGSSGRHMSTATTFPRMFGKYALLRPFARGGMGEICLAAHGELGGLEKLCLVKKVLPTEDQVSLTNRLLDEAKVAVRLNHANLVQVFDAGKVDEELYIAMELIEGRDMRAVWNRTAERRSRIPLDVALYVVREMARGLEYAHNYGGLNLVHRDIAPPNILLSWHGEVKITDFGLARSTLKSEKTAPGIVYGRIAYLAPEQARGEQADKRTDLFAVGVILWELLTGRPLHETTDEAVKNLEMARHPRLEAPSHFTRGISASLDAIVLKALAPKRDDRYQTAEDLRRELSEELARVAPTTEASRLAAWLSEQFVDEVKTEAIEHERLLREELPLLRARTSSQLAALAKAPAVVKAQSLDLRIAGVDREEPARAREGIARTLPPDDEPLRSSTATPARPTAGAARRPAVAHFDDEGETHVQSDHRDEPTANARIRGAAQPVQAPKFDLENEELFAEKLIGEVVEARYRIEKLLGTGGMGAVYEAEHIEIGKKVALKVLHPQFSRQADLVQRFRREARAASKVGHPNIIDVTDSGTTDSGDAYFVMERLDGTDLADVLRHERRLAVDRTVGIGAQICRALNAAHQAGIIHRDLKPENIFLVARDGQPDFVKVLDFGIAKSENVAQTSRRLTTPGIAMGTPEYMAPEQAAGKTVDGRVDIYSVGAILYEMLCGEPPHAGTSVMDVLAKKATQPAEPLRQRNASVPEALEVVIMACLEREPSARPQTMSALEYELNKYARGRGSAVAAVLGIKADDGGWGEEISRTGQFDGGYGVRHRTGPIGIGMPIPDGAPVRSGAIPTVPTSNLADTLEPSAPGVELIDATASLRPTGGNRVLGILGGLVFLAAGGYFAWSYLAVKPQPQPQPTKSPVAQHSPTEGTVEPPKPDPALKKAEEPTAGEDHASEQDVTSLLDWARRAADGGRIIAPAGDNLKDLLDRIEKKSPGNAVAADLRTKAGAALGRRAVLALKKNRFEEAEESLRALTAIKPDDEWAKGRLARTLALRGDRSLERKRYVAAATDATSALEILPDDVLARDVLGDADLAQGKREQAVAEYKHVLELRPADKRARRGLGTAIAPAPKRAAKGGKTGKKKSR